MKFTIPEKKTKDIAYPCLKSYKGPIKGNTSIPLIVLFVDSERGICLQDCYKDPTPPVRVGKLQVWDTNPDHWEILDDSIVVKMNNTQNT
jgi:hypothetical protein